MFLLLFLVFNLVSPLTVDEHLNGSFNFTLAAYNGSISENCPPRSYVKTEQLLAIPVTASTLRLKSKISISIASGNSEDFFTAEEEQVGGFWVVHIRTKTGHKDVLNRERRSEYRLRIVARLLFLSQLKQKSLETSTLVRVSVKDQNDNIPLFFPDSYEIEAFEDLLLNSPLTSVKAQDADYGVNGEIYYSLSDPSSNLFSVHPETGLVSLTKSLQGLHNQSYQFKVKAKDKGYQPKHLRNHAVAEARISVTVKQRNKFSPSIIVKYLPKIIEGANVHIYATIVISDSDHGADGELSYLDIIDGDPDNIFSLRKRRNAKNEYNILINKFLSRRAAPHGYNITIRATDNGVPRRSTDKSIVVSFDDAAFNFPIFFKEHYDDTISEDAPPNSPVVKIAAFNKNSKKNSLVTFKLVAGNGEQKFRINSETGLISTANWLDAESKAYYSLTVAAIDLTSSSSKKQSSAKITITILDTNDNAPQFRTPNTEVTIDENEPYGSYVTKVSATDLDSNENSFITYSISNLNETPFSINPFDGVIRTSSLIDFEEDKKVYTVIVRASDWGQPFRRETETTVIIKIRDVNDNVPYFTTRECIGWIPAKSPVGSHVIRLEAIDLDVQDKVQYDLSVEDQESCWSIDSRTGELTVGCDLELAYLRIDKSASVIINVTASDGLYTSEPISVSISIVDGDRMYESDLPVDTKSQVNCKSDFNSTPTATKKVFYDAYDSEENPTVRPVSVKYEYNANSPQFEETTFPSLLNVSEDTKVGKELFRVSATDIDFGFNGRVVYAISSGDLDSVFNIDINSGVVSLVGQLDRERTSVYHLNITAYDLGATHRSSSKNASVYILDVNDNSPEFTLESRSLYLPEDSEKGSSVALFLAIDPDEGENAEVTYQLVTLTSHFKLDSVSGNLYLTSNLDREEISEFELHIRAWDNGKYNRQYSVAKIFVFVTDVNDCAPDFGVSSNMVVAVPEDYPVGTVVGTLTATDKDEGDGANIFYIIEETGIGNENFRIDSQTGVVRISSPLDFERNQVHNLTIHAKDGGMPPLSTKTSLLVIVRDVYETSESPKFLQLVVQTWIKENEDSGTFVTSLPVSGGDGSLFFSITEGDGIGLFSVTNTGDLLTLRLLDRESADGYWLKVSTWAADDALQRQSDTCWVYVGIEDVNDHFPQTSEPSYRVQVSEDAPSGTPVLQIKASDADVSKNFSSVSFSVKSVKGRGFYGVASDRPSVFSLGRDNGLLVTAGTLDRELESHFEVLVSVSDGELGTVTPVLVTVTDVNDNGPRFLEKVYRVTVPESLPEGLPQRLMRVYAEDLDEGPNAQLEYFLKNKLAAFRLNPKTGVLAARTKLRGGDSFDLLVEVQDSGRPRRSSSARVLLRVAHSQTASQGALSVKLPSPVHLTESDRPGHLVAVLTAHQEEGLAFWCYITDGDPSHQFSLTPDTCLLTVAKPLDRERSPGYLLTIGVTDGENLVRTELSVTVLDSNDHLPTFTQSHYHVTVPESAPVGSSLTSLLCTDGDHAPAKVNTSKGMASHPPEDSASPLYFSLEHTKTTSSQGFFSIDSTTGELTVSQPLDREVTAYHEVTVSCQDRGSASNADHARVAIAVTDSNDHYPMFFETMLSAVVSSNAAVGSVIRTVRAVDADTGLNGKLGYSIIEGNSGGVFSIDPERGIIRLAIRLSSSPTKEYLILVRAADHHVPHPRSASLPVRITVTMATDVPPSWTKALHFPSIPSQRSTPTRNFAAQVIEVSEWAPRGTVVAVVAVATPTWSLQYEIAESGFAENCPNNLFVVTPSSGVLSLAGQLDREKCDWYNITVTATTAVGLSSSTWVGVAVQDRNDCSPHWGTFPTMGVVQENADIGQFVLVSDLPTPQILAVSATDCDKGANGKVTYHHASTHPTAPLFRVESHTGVVRVIGNLSSIAGQLVEIPVWAADTGNPPKESDGPVFLSIKVKKMNLFAPQFSSNHYFATLLLPTAAGVQVFCASASDPDDIRPFPSAKQVGQKQDEKETKVLYSFSGESNTLHSFSIDETEGCVYVKDESGLKDVNNLTILAFDGHLNGSSSLTISVSDSHDLRFSETVYRANVLENSTKEANLLVISVRNMTVNQHITYTILNPTAKLRIHPTSGVLQTTGIVFDREQTDEVTVIVQAWERSSKRRANVKVVLTVLDVNDNEPAFVNQPYHALVPVSAEKGHLVLQVRAVDADSGNLGSVRYELVRGSGEVFAVGRTTGRVLLRQGLVGQGLVGQGLVGQGLVGQGELSLTVAAYDGGEPPLGSQAQVTIRVVSSGVPVFPAPVYRASVPEDAPIGTPITRVVAQSPEGASPLTYSIIRGDSSKYFQFHFTSGILQSRHAFDFESFRWHNLTVRATDPASGSFSDALVTVAVRDVNDNAPRFAQKHYRGSVSEAAAPGTLVLKVDATDEDSGPGGRVRYSCAGDCSNGFFEVSPLFGELLVARRLDAESDSLHRLQIVATDEGMSRLSSAVNVIVSVEDFNDNPPAFVEDSFSCSVSSKAPLGHLLQVVKAKDIDRSDKDNLLFDITAGNEKGIFSIHETSGAVRLSAPHLLRASSSHLLNVSVSDGAHIATSTLLVNVFPANDHPPRFHRSRFVGSVPENSPPGTSVLTVEASDRDRGTFGQLDFFLAANSELFTLDSKGTVSTQALLDREHQSTHALTIGVRDGGGVTDFAEVTIEVLDANDNAPAFNLPQYQANVPVDTPVGETVMKVAAEDPDEGNNRKLFFFFDDEESKDFMSLFGLDPETGEMILKSPISHDAAGTVYQLAVHVSDKGSPPLRSQAPLTVFLLSPSQPLPVCRNTFTQFSLPEDTSPGTVITSLWVGGPLLVKYALHSDLFTITPSGHLVLQNPLNFEVSRAHTLIIANETLHRPPMVDYCTISILVLDINDNSPQFDKSSYSLTVPEDAPVGSTLMTLEATDRDHGANGRVHFRFSSSVSPSILSLLQLSPFSGALTLLSPLDRETVPLISFSVAATDGGHPALEAQATVTITVGDFNDCPPVFEKATLRARVSEDAAPGTPLTTLSLSDEDLLSAPLQFIVASGDPEGVFRVSSGGQVLVAGDLDRELQAHFTLGVVATDGKFSVNASLLIDVEDVNDNSPECSDATLQLTISEDSPPGSPIITFTIWDPDIVGTNRFTLVGATSKYFSLGEVTGELSIRLPLDREKTPLHHLTIMATDTKFPERVCSLTAEVAVTDVNDNAPQFELHQYTVTAAENTVVNSVVAKVVARDADEGANAEVQYRLLADPTGHFTLADPSEGLLLLSRPLDRERIDSVTAIIVASDSGKPSLSATATLVVNVADVNDNLPEFEEKIQHISVPENTVFGTEIAKVSAVSKDTGLNAQIRYSLEGSSFNRFVAVNPVTGVVSVAGSIDFEEVDGVLVTILATDKGSPPLSSASLLNISITDVNDNPPTFSQRNYSVTVSEGAPVGEVVVTVGAEDRDSGANGAIHFSIASGDELGHFAMDGQLGDLTVGKPLDREKVADYLLAVRAYDGGQPSLFSQVFLKVTLLDVNDNPPLLGRENYSAVVQQNKRTGDLVTSMTCSDPDEDEVFTWELRKGLDEPHSAPFAVESDGKVVLTSHAEDLEVGEIFHLRVRVWDSGSPPLYSETLLSVRIVEKSKHPPSVYPLHVTIFSYFSAFPGGLIGRVSAVDDDPYDTLRYTVGSTRNPNIENYFSVNEMDGSLSAVSKLDGGTYHVNVSVSDGTFARSADAEVAVFVLSQEMVGNSIILIVGPVTAEEFLARYKNLLVRAISSAIQEDQEKITVASLQQRRIGSLEMKNDNLDILLAIQKRNGDFYSRQEAISAIRRKKNQIRQKISLKYFDVMKSLCKSEECSEQGECVDDIVMENDNLTLLNTRLTSIVAPSFEHRALCLCNLGYEGDRCQNLANACGLNPCSEWHFCVPTNSSVEGYLCNCPKGFAGQQCQFNVNECRSLSCFYPQQPLSFNGNSYVQYSSVQHNDASSLQLSFYVKTRHPVGTFYYSGGVVDYCLLEISKGFVQFKWDCGSGEGVVRVTNQRVDDGKWHFIELMREGTVSVLSVDGIKSSGISPGENDVLSVNASHIIFGAYLSSSNGRNVDYGFVGCLDQITLNGLKLPLSTTYSDLDSSVSLKRLMNVDLTCLENLPAPGVCSSHPCSNGGTCLELSKSQFKCSCLEKFTGSQCEVNTAPCSPSLCLNGGECLVTGHNFTCKCPRPLSGKYCEYGVHCSPNPCLNGGLCEEGSKGPICKCRHFTGLRCAEDLNECASVPCQNGGTCLNFFGGFTCRCSEGFSGQYCNAHLDLLSEYRFSMQELIIMLSSLISFALIFVTVVMLRRKRWNKKRGERSESPSASHYKNDLRASSDSLQRNSKLCNLETGLAAGVTFSSPREESDLHKEPKDASQWTEGLELDIISRERSWILVNNLKSSLVYQANEDYGMRSSQPLLTFGGCGRILSDENRRASQWVLDDSSDALSRQKSQERLLNPGYHNALPEVVLCSYDPLKPTQLPSSPSSSFLNAARQSASQPDISDLGVDHPSPKPLKWMKTAPRNKAIKVDPVDVNKLPAVKSNMSFTQEHVSKASPSLTPLGEPIGPTTQESFQVCTHGKRDDVS